MRMPFTEEMKNVRLFVSELPYEQQNEIAQSLAKPPRRVRLRQHFDE